MPSGGPGVDHQSQIRDSLVQWKKPLRQVIFREWYISNYCNEANVRLLDWIQGWGGRLQRLFILFFQGWSFTGEAEFYTLFIPTLLWLGSPKDSIQVASMLCMSQFVTGSMKDSVCCPRPPCPPLEMRGKRETHDREYGFPSTHSSHSGVFSYFLYCVLSRFFPEYAFSCWLFSVFFFVSVCFSRIYLGMHWVADLVGGWAVAFICILFHVSFVDRWEMAIISADHVSWWAYVLVYAVIHVLSMLHATPHDPCPCYIDSMRFLGVMMGSCVGFWSFKAQFGDLTARPEQKSIRSVAFTTDFLIQWLCCLIIVGVGKEVASFLGGKLLKVIFTFLSGAYAGSMPRVLRAPYLVMARLVGTTTRGNERGPLRYYPTTRDNSFAFSAGTTPIDPSFALIPTSTGTGGNARSQTPQQQRHMSGWDETVWAPPGIVDHKPHSNQPAACVLFQDSRTTTTTTTRVALPVGIYDVAGDGKLSGSFLNGTGNAAQTPVRASGGALTNQRLCGDMVEEPDGYLNSYQTWSLRTHRHWWLWEVHQRTFAYFVTGILVTYVCPLLLRVVFQVGVVAVTAATIGTEINGAADML